MISHSHKFLFVHVPKTGGTSIELALDKYNTHDSAKSLKGEFRPIGSKHLLLSGYINHKGSSFCIPEDSMDDYFKFSFARNPWARIFSHFRMFKRSGPARATDSLKSFVKFYCLKKRGDTCWKGRNFLPALDHVLFNGSIAADFIGRFENLQKDFDFVCDQIGVPRKQLPHVNKSKIHNYVDHYDEETKQIVAEKYAKDIDHFGYKFGE